MKGMHAIRSIADDYVGQDFRVEISSPCKYQLVYGRYTGLLCIAQERIRRRNFRGVLVGMH